MKLHSAVAAIFSSLDNRDLSLAYVERASGVGRATMYRWRQGYAPKLPDLVAVLDVLGFDLCVLPKPEYRHEAPVFATRHLNFRVRRAATE